MIQLFSWSCSAIWCSFTDVYTFELFLSLGYYSVKHEYEGNWGENLRLTTCDPSGKLGFGLQEVKDNTEIIFTYDVNFQVNS